MQVINLTLTLMRRNAEFLKKQNPTSFPFSKFADREKEACGAKVTDQPPEAISQ